jgi:hypothetical protein
MKFRYINKELENGFVLVGGVFFLLALFGVLGLAVDASKLYMTKLRIQRAVDAAAVAGSRLISSPQEDQALDFATNHATQALISMGYKVGNITVNSRWLDPINRTEISVDGAIDVPAWIITLLPGVSEINPVHAVGVATSRSATVCLAIDISGSMTATARSGNTKMKDLIDALSGIESPPGNLVVPGFIDYFEEGYDAIGFATYNLEIRETRPMTNQFLQFRDVFRGLVADGFTNTESALRECYRHLTTSPISLARSSASIILVTDGGPTASCENQSDDSNGFRGTDCTYYSNPNDVWNYPRHTDRAIRTADFIRSQGIPIHAVGIGVPLTIRDAPAGRIFPDIETQFRDLNPDELREATAYQDLGGEGLKEVFLRRVTNNPQRNLIEPTQYFGSFPAVRGGGFTIDNFENYNIRNPNAPQGIFLEVSDTSELNRMLAQIALSLKSRLIK